MTYWHRRRSRLMMALRAPIVDPRRILLKGDGAQDSMPVDSSPYNWTLSGSGVSVDTTIKKYGAGSVRCLNTGLGISTPSDLAAWDIGVNDFTIQFWVYPTVSSTTKVIAHLGASATASRTFMVTHSSGRCIFNGYVGTDTTLFTLIPSASSAPLNTWVHHAIVRQGATMRMYVGGVQQATKVVNSLVLNAPGAGLYFGADPAGLNDFTGYFDDFEFVFGQCLYPDGTTFTPPGALS